MHTKQIFLFDFEKIIEYWAFSVKVVTSNPWTYSKDFLEYFILTKFFTTSLSLLKSTGTDTS